MTRASCQASSSPTRSAAASQPRKWGILSCSLRVWAAPAASIADHTASRTSSLLRILPATPICSRVRFSIISAWERAGELSHARHIAHRHQVTPGAVIDVKAGIHKLLPREGNQGRQAPEFRPRQDRRSLGIPSAITLRCDEFRLTLRAVCDKFPVLKKPPNLPTHTLRETAWNRLLSPWPQGP